MHSPALERLRLARQGRLDNGDATEIDRVLALPRRPVLDLESKEAQDLASEVTARFARHNPRCKCKALGRPYCITKLLPIQAWTLDEIARTARTDVVGGGIGGIAVGGGKTGLDILAALAVPDVKTAVLLVPPMLMAQLYDDLMAWREHFRVPTMLFNKTRGEIVPGAPVVQVIPFSKFSRHESTALLNAIAPDLIIVDECHKVRNPDTATTSRVMRYLKANPKTRLCAWSGTLTTKSITDYAHLCKHALGEGSPLPLKANNLSVWAGAIDPSASPVPPGKLTKLCGPGEDLYAGFQRRLRETPGVITTSKSAVDVSLFIEERKLKAPREIEDLMLETRRTFVRPDGEELVDAMQVWACLTQLASGFYYRYIFPRGEPEHLIRAWFSARKDWNSEVREALQTRKEHLDSPLLLKRAAKRYYAGDTSGPQWAAKTWPAWAELEKAVEPVTQAVWVDDYMVRDAINWGKRHTGVVWYIHDALGVRIAREGGFPLFGPDSAEEILQEDGSRTIVASIKSHGTGRDGLQHRFSEQLVANPPSSGGEWEQLLGRLHRVGQSADEVRTWVYRHTPELRRAIDNAIIQAKYIEGTMGTQQKLFLATVGFRLPPSALRDRY